MSITIDKDRALELLREAVNERGADYVYTDEYGDLDGRCFYVERDEQGNKVPGCIVALALNKAGVTIDQLLTLGDSGEVHGASSTASELCQTLNTEGVAEIDRNALTLFGLAQSKQDRGDTWGDALQSAVNHATYLH